METLVNSISRYQIVINLIPGYIFVLLLERYANIHLFNGEIVDGIFISYFVGVIIGRIGSLIIENTMKKISKPYKHAPEYASKIKAEKNDLKIETIDKQCTIYRNLCECCLCVILAIVLSSVVYGKSNI